MSTVIRAGDGQDISSFTPPSFEGDAYIIQWSAPEYRMYVYGRRWYIVVTGIVALLLLWALFSRNYFFVAFVVLSYTLMLYYAKRTPRFITFSLSSRGVGVGEKFYEFKDIKSFCVFDRTDGAELLFERKSTGHQPISIPLGDFAVSDARNFLLRFIPEVQREESNIDQAGRVFGF